MIQSNCPRCNDPIRLPAAEFPDDAYAQCPWCRATFPAAEVLKSLPPVLEVFAADGQPLAVTPQPVGLAAGVVDFAPSLGPGNDDAMLIEQALESEMGPSTADETVVDDENVPVQPLHAGTTVSEETVTEQTWKQELANDLQPSAAASTEPEADHGDAAAMETEIADFDVQEPDAEWGEVRSTAPIAPMKVSPAPPVKRRRPHKNTGLRTAIGVVLGGVASIPIAGGLLMALGQTPDWGFWPFDGGGSSPSGFQAAPLAESSSGTPLGSDADFADTDTVDPATAAAQQIVAPSDALSDQPEIVTVGGQPSETPGDGDAASQAMATAGPDTESPGIDTADSDGSGSRGTASDVGSAPSDPDPTDPAVVANVGSPTLVPIEPSDERSAADPEDTPSSASAEMTEPASPASESISADSLESGLTPAEESASAESVSPPDAATSRGDQPSVPDTSTPQSPEMVAASELAVKMIDAVSTFEGAESERTKRLVKTYRQIALACDLATDDGPPIRAMMDRIQNSPILQDIEALVGAEWLKSTQRKSTGVALVGRASPDGKRLTLTSGKVVEVGNKPLPRADRVLALGRIIDNDSIELIVASPLPLQ